MKTSVIAILSSILLTGCLSSPSRNGLSELNWRHRDSILPDAIAERILTLLEEHPHSVAQKQPTDAVGFGRGCDVYVQIETTDGRSRAMLYGVSDSFVELQSREWVAVSDSPELVVSPLYFTRDKTVVNTIMLMLMEPNKTLEATSHQAD